MPRRAKNASKVAQVDLRRVERLADLSRLSLSPQEAERLQGELASILEYFATLDEVDISKIAEPRDGPSAGGMRQDVVQPSTPEDLLKGVPQRKGRFVKAPRVF